MILRDPESQKKFMDSFLKYCIENQLDITVRTKPGKTKITIDKQFPA